VRYLIACGSTAHGGGVVEERGGGGGGIKLSVKFSPTEENIGGTKEEYCETLNRFLRLHPKRPSNEKKTAKKKKKIGKERE